MTPLSYNNYPYRQYTNLFIFWFVFHHCLRSTLHFMFLSDEGPTFKTLDFAFYIGSTPTFLYFDLYFITAYAAHYTFYVSLWRRAYARNVRLFFVQLYTVKKYIYFIYYISRSANVFKFYLQIMHNYRYGPWVDVDLGGNTCSVTVITNGYMGKGVSGCLYG